VDAVTGATATSKGIMEAVANALGAGNTDDAGKPASKESTLPATYTDRARRVSSAEKNKPRVTTLSNGVQVQTVPSDDRGWNNAYLDADMRGCNACHVLEDIVTQMDSYHGVVYYKYNNTQTVATCIACHSFYKAPLRDTIHGTHLGNAGFQGMNGSCQSCHYINGKGEYERWDYVKYDHLAGITDIPADQVNVDIRYDQNVITPIENMYYKSIKTVVLEPSDWLTDDSQIIPAVKDQWEIKVHGDMDNPFTMKLNDMVEKFGTVTQVMSSQCCINGAGESMIFQSEVTGIPLSRIFEYAKVHSDVTTYNAVGYDTYGSGGNSYPLNYSFVVANDGILVTEVNGQPIPANQGYPVASWVYNASSGNNVKCVNEIIVTKEENPAHWALVGDFIDPATGEVFSKPNIGVLSTQSGTIFPAGQPIHLEGYADAWDEPILSMEYSFDHGKTWVKVETPENDSRRWTYWYLDFSPEAPGAYLLRMRATSLTNQGEERVSNIYTDFLMNVQ
jgi:DMSO/TMAO reductase YedYZ molybdopterin-dependent catalytic subunit